MLKENSVLRAEARASLAGNWTEAVLATLLYMLINVGVSCIPFLNYVTFFFINLPLTFGYTTAMLLFFRGTKNNTLKDLFSVTDNYPHILGVTVLQFLYTLLWSLLFLIPGIIKSYSYAMTYYIAKDNENMTADECIETSMRLMDGNKMKLFLLDLSFIGWGLLTILTFGIGTLWLLPYMYNAHAAFYEDLLAAQNTNDNNVQAEPVQPEVQPEAAVEDIPTEQSATNETDLLTDSSNK